MSLRPNREPDFIDKFGGYYWFDELLYLCGRSSRWEELDVHPMCDRLIIKNVTWKCKDCFWCDKNSVCKYAFLNKEAEEARNARNIKLFEDIVFGEQD